MRGTGAGGSPGTGRATPRAARLPRPRQRRCPAFAHRRGRGADPQSRRAGARGRHGGIAAVPRTHRRAVSRTRGRIHDGADPQRRRFGGAKGGKADPMEAGKIRTLRWSPQSDAPPKIAPFAMYSPDKKQRPFVMTDNIERFPGESRGPSLGDTISGQMGPGFPHGTCPWAEGPRDSGPRTVSSRAGRPPAGGELAYRS
jgi:hypothetical protein